MSDAEKPVAVTADRKEYYHIYYLKRRDELLAKAKQRNEEKKATRPRGRQPGKTFPNGYRRRDASEENIQPAGALRSPPGNDKIYETTLSH